MNNSLTNISAARRALAKASTLNDVLEIRDKAEAIRVYIKAAAESLETQNAAAEIKLRAERKAGEMLAAMELHDGDPRSHDVTRLADLGISKMQSSRWQKEAAVPDDKFESWIAECQEEKKELTQSGLLQLAGAGHVSAASGENEWYTPAKFIEAAREAMGSIDLDPASCTAANKTVKATRFFTIADDGLAKEWAGNVWLNPPYSKDLCKRFIDKLLSECESGRVLQAVVLVNNATETAWGQSLLSAASAVCFPAGRVQFTSKSGDKANSPLQGQLIAYFGSRVGEFFNSLRQVGSCLRTPPSGDRLGRLRAEVLLLLPHEMAVLRDWLEGEDGR